VTLCMAGELLGLASPNLKTLTAPLPKAEHELKEPKPQLWNHGPLLPVHIVLRDFAAQLPAAGQPVNAETVWAYLCGRLKQAALEDFGPHLHEELLQRGGLILLDGLDEVPDALTRREQVKQAVQDFVSTFSRCRFLVTSRTYAYQRQDWKLTGFAEVGLQPFTRGQINAFVDAWYAHMMELVRLTEGDARGRAEILKRTVANNERIRELAERPLLLTLIAQLQTEAGGVLPEKREELYDKAVEMLLNKWEGLKIRRRADGTPEIEPSLAEWLNASRDDIRKQLNRLAFEAHLNQTELIGTADIRKSDLIMALLEASDSQKTVDVRRLEDYLRDRAGILAEHGIGLYQFPHRSFQEYLAACHLTDDEFPDKIAELTRNDPNRWREVALLAGAKAARGSTSNVWNLVEALCFAPVPSGHALPADSWGALLAGQMLVDNADLTSVAPRNVSKRDRVRDWQVHLLTGELPPVERALAGRNLAVLGDPRKGVGVVNGLPDIDWVMIPDDGEFVYGDKSEGKGPKKLRLPAYKISRYPITYAQFQAFIDAPDGFGNARWWEGLAVDSDHWAQVREPGFRFDNHPREFVSWFDAMAFCRWLSEKSAEDVRLPTEQEWEKAARGRDGRAYPWGNDYVAGYANIDETEGSVGPNSVQMTTAVGMYSQGASPYGLMDVAGNVWEWCLNEYDHPERTQISGTERRLLRGGSWVNYIGNARCAYRRRYPPDNRFNDIGFRVCVGSAPVSSLGPL